MMNPSMNHEQLAFLQDRVKEESASSSGFAHYAPYNAEMAETPCDIGENDVLCGRGGLTNSHQGNIAFRRIVADHQTQYLKARKRDKMIIANRIVQIVHDNGGRFLRREGTAGWSPIADKKAQEKTSQALREGLDVRNQKLRPDKQIRCGYNKNNKEDSKPRKTPTVAVGKGMLHQTSSPHTLPVLQDEPAAMSFPMYHFMFPHPSDVQDTTTEV